MKNRNNSFWSVFCISIGILLLCGAGSMLIMEVSDYHKASNIYKDADEIYVSYADSDEDNHIYVVPVGGEIELDTQNADNTRWDKFINVDLTRLRDINEDVVGWIYFENVDISYPVVYSGDNEEYLRKTYIGENAKAGSIFVDGDNSSDFSDVHTIIYGHNMKDLSMFGRLKNYAKDSEYILGHEYFQIITEGKKYRYKIITYKVVADDSAVYTTYKNYSQDFETFVKNVIEKGSYLSSNVIVGNDDHLITLSTCSGEDRLVVSAIRCGECAID